MSPSAVSVVITEWIVKKRLAPHDSDQFYRKGQKLPIAMNNAQSVKLCEWPAELPQARGGDYEWPTEFIKFEIDLIEIFIKR